MAPFGLPGWLKGLPPIFSGSQATPQHHLQQQSGYPVENQAFQASPTPSQHEQQFYDSLDAKSPLQDHVSPHTNGHHFDGQPSAPQDPEQHYQGNLAPRMVGHQHIQHMQSHRQGAQQNYPSHMTPQQIQQHLHKGFPHQQSLQQRFPSNISQQGLQQHFPNNVSAQQVFQHNLVSNVSPGQHLQSGFQTQQVNRQRFMHQVAPQAVGNHFGGQGFHNRSAFPAHSQPTDPRFPHQHVGQALFQENLAPHRRQQQQIQPASPSQQLEQQIQQQLTDEHAPSARPQNDATNQYSGGVDSFHDRVQYGGKGVSQGQNHNASGFFSMGNGQEHVNGAHLLDNQRQHYALAQHMTIQQNGAVQDATELEQIKPNHPVEAMEMEDALDEDDHDDHDNLSDAPQSALGAQGVRSAQDEKSDAEMDDEHHDEEVDHEYMNQEATQGGVDQEMDHEGLDEEMEDQGITQEGQHAMNGQEMEHGAHNEEEIENASQHDGDSGDEEEESEDEEESEEETEDPRSSATTPQSHATRNTGSTQRSETPVQYNVTDTSELVPMIRGPDPSKDLSKLFLSHERFHLKAWSFKPNLALASHRYWIAVLHLDKQPKSIASEKHFTWMKGNRFTTVETVWRTYQTTSMAEDFVLMLGYERTNFKNTMEELDVFGDKFVCFRASTKGKDGSIHRGYFDEVVPKSAATEVVKID